MATTACNAADQLLRANVDRRGSRTAIFYGDDRITWAELSGQVDRFAGLLLGSGIRPRETVVVQLPDEPLCVGAFLGAIKAGIWPVLVSPDSSVSALEYILNDAQAAALVTRRETAGAPARSSSVRRVLLVDEPEFAAARAAAPAPLAPAPTQADEIAFFLYTSGSTGHPKGVPHRHRDMLFCADSYGAGILGTTDRDVHFSASKLFFAYGLGNSLFLPFRAGAAVILHPGKPTPQEIFRILAIGQPTVFFAVPSLYSMLLKSWPEDLRLVNLRLCVSAGEALPAALYHQWRRRTGVDLIDGIGSTEALHIFISNRPGEVQPGSSGVVVPPYEAKIITDDGQPADGQPGHLLIRGGSTATYYWNRPEETQETMLPDGWLKTGDIYVRQGDCYTYQGRADDMFKVDARWVAPARVEAVLQSHPAVREAGVTWRLLEQLVRPVAHVVLNPGFVPQGDLELQLRRQVRDRLPDYMCPVQVEFCRELPRTETGKLQRFRLRLPASSAPETGPSSRRSAGTGGRPTADSPPEAVTPQDLVEVMLQAGFSRDVVACLKFDQPLLDQGLDSMDLPALSAAAEKRFHVNLFEAGAADLKTVNDFAAYVNRQRGAGGY